MLKQQVCKKIRQKQKTDIYNIMRLTVKITYWVLANIVFRLENKDIVFCTSIVVPQVLRDMVPRIWVSLEVREQVGSLSWSQF